MKKREYFFSKCSNDRGVSLIALVVTVIVLIILAGVSITSLTGEKGLIKKAKNAKKDFDVAANDEASDVEKLQDPNANFSDGGSLDYGSNFNGSDVNNNFEGKDGKNVIHINYVEDLLEIIHDTRTTNPKMNLENSYCILDRSLDFKDPSSYRNANDKNFMPDYNDNGVSDTIMKELTDISGCGLKNGYDWKGIFDGNFHSITNFYSNVDLSMHDPVILGDSAYAGFFKHNYGTIKNLTIQGKMNCNLNKFNDAYSYFMAAAFAASNSGELYRCHSVVDINFTGANDLIINNLFRLRIGAIAGINYCGTINKCTNRGRINVDLNYNFGTVDPNCTGDSIHIGGIAGRNEFRICNCINYGDVSLIKSANQSIDKIRTIYVGGITGESEIFADKNNEATTRNISMIENCVNSGRVNGKCSRAGVTVAGISAESHERSEHRNCFNIGNISGDSPIKFEIGGVLGYGRGDLGVNEFLYNIGNLQNADPHRDRRGAIIGNLSGKHPVNLVNCEFREESGLFDVENSNHNLATAVPNLSVDTVLNKMKNNAIEHNKVNDNIYWETFVNDNGTVKFK